LVNSLKIGSSDDIGVVKFDTLYGRLATNLKKINFSRFGKKVEYKEFDLTNYGCWCRGDNWLHGKGQPVDEFDEICRLQHHNYDCLLMEDPTCDVVDGLYWYNIYVDNGVIVVDCDDSNDACATNLCMIDVEVVSRYVSLSNAMFFPTFHDFGHFESGHGPFLPEFECPRGENHIRQKECCGSFPYREWYLTSDDEEFKNRECCEYNNLDVQADWEDLSIKVGRYYDTSIEVCCDDGVAVIGGRCG